MATSLFATIAGCATPMTDPGDPSNLDPLWAAGGKDDSGRPAGLFRFTAALAEPTAPPYSPVTFAADPGTIVVDTDLQNNVTFRGSTSAVRSAARGSISHHGTSPGRTRATSTPSSSTR